jgi:hypothetical protein
MFSDASSGVNLAAGRSRSSRVMAGLPPGWPVDRPVASRALGANALLGAVASVLGWLVAARLVPPVAVGDAHPARGVGIHLARGDCLDMNAYAEAKGTLIGERAEAWAKRTGWENGAG